MIKILNFINRIFGTNYYYGKTPPPGAMKSLGNAATNVFSKSSDAVSDWVAKNPNLGLGLGTGAGVLALYALWNAYQKKRLQNKLIKKGLGENINASFEYPYYDGYDGINEGNEGYIHVDKNGINFYEETPFEHYGPAVAGGALAGLTIGALIKYLMSRGTKKDIQKAQELSSIVNSVENDDSPVNESGISGTLSYDDKNDQLLFDGNTNGMNPGLAGGITGAVAGALSGLSVYALIKLLNKMGRNDDARKVADIANNISDSKTMEESYIMNYYDDYSSIDEGRISDLLNKAASKVKGAASAAADTSPRQAVDALLNNRIATMIKSATGRIPSLEEIKEFKRNIKPSELKRIVDDLPGQAKGALKGTALKASDILHDLGTSVEAKHEKKNMMTKLRDKAMNLSKEASGYMAAMGGDPYRGIRKDKNGKFVGKADEEELRRAASRDNDVDVLYKIMGKGYDAAKSAAKGAVDMARHPLDTAKGIAKGAAGTAIGASDLTTRTLANVAGKLARGAGNKLDDFANRELRGPLKRSADAIDDSYKKYQERKKEEFFRKVREDLGGDQSKDLQKAYKRMKNNHSESDKIFDEIKRKIK